MEVGTNHCAWHVVDKPVDRELGSYSLATVVVSETLLFPIRPLSNFLKRRHTDGQINPAAP
jgi:hypothetical protein